MASLAKWLVFLQLALTHSSWAFFIAKESLRQRVSGSRYRTRVREYDSYSLSLEQAIASVTSQPAVLVQSVLENSPSMPRQLSSQALIPASWNASPQLANSVYALCRLMKPSLVVETGVGQGITSFYILQALHENGTGHLYSIDLPALHRKAMSSIGCLVPERLKSRWTLRLGLSQHILPRLLKEIGAVDIFVHDSSHTYWCQLLEYSLAWPSLRPEGILLSDDISNDSFIETAEDQGVVPIIISQSKSSPIGMLVKPTPAPSLDKARTMEGK